MNKIPVVFTFDKRIILGAAVSIKSMIDHALPTTVYDIYVYHPNIKDKTIKHFEKMLDGTDHTITFEYLDGSRFDDVPINTRSGWVVTFFRLLIPELLPQYDKVIYSDVDVLFTADMWEVYNDDLTNYEWAGVRAEHNSPEIEMHKYFIENKSDFIYWPGFMVMNTKFMRENKFIDRCFETMYKFNTRLKFRDLDVINLTCTRVKHIPFKYCTLQSIYYLDNISDAEEYKMLSKIYSDEILMDARNNPAIIHYAGKPGKPWRMKHPYDNYKLYMELIPKALKISSFRDIRKRFFNKV